MRSKTWTYWLALVLAVGLAGVLGADDRDFLRERSAPPNLIFILDTSKSMVGSPELPGRIQGAKMTYGMVPGAGDDPYSRMGIAKRVLRDFLEDIADANYALAGYAQAQPSDGSNPVPQKHWVYEARSADRFSMVDLQYAYRIGYNESFAGALIDNPADILKGELMGYSPYFDPDTSTVTDRFGPTTGWETLIEEVPGDPNTRLPYDLMPVYFFNCFIDDMGTAETSDDVTLCRDNVFPFYPTGDRDASGNMIVDEWYYGDQVANVFPDCTPNRTPDALNPDDGCLAEWEQVVGSDVIQHRRRVQLRIPGTNPVGDANHPLGVDTLGAPIGNQLVPDSGVDDYDLDGSTADPDLDGDEANDWILYVNAVEEQQSRTCSIPLPTPTPTVSCNQMSLTANPANSGFFSAVITNTSAYDIQVARTTVDWQPLGGIFLDFFEVTSAGSPNYTNNHYWGGNGGNGVAPNTSDDPADEFTAEPSLAIIPAGTTRNWFSDVDNGSLTPSGLWELCLRVDVIGNPRSCDLCDDAGTEILPTYTPTPTPGTPTRTYTPRPPTQTYTPPPPTNTPTWAPPTQTYTPRPPTQTYTPAPPTRTYTPAPPTQTYTPRPPTNTPTRTYTPRPPTATPTRTPTPAPPTPTPTFIE